MRCVNARSSHNEPRAPSACGTPAQLNRYRPMVVADGWLPTSPAQGITQHFLRVSYGGSSTACRVTSDRVTSEWRGLQTCRATVCTQVRHQYIQWQGILDRLANTCTHWAGCSQWLARTKLHQPALRFTSGEIALLRLVYSRPAHSAKARPPASRFPPVTGHMCPVTEVPQEPIPTSGPARHAICSAPNNRKAHPSPSLRHRLPAGRRSTARLLVSAFCCVCPSAASS